jgi:hypothetical protein
MHLLAWSQGIATLANAFHDENFIREEVRRLHDWLQSLAANARRKQRAQSINRTPKSRQKRKQGG